MVVGFGWYQPYPHPALPLFPVRRAPSLWHQRVHDSCLLALRPDPIAVAHSHRRFLPGIGSLQSLLLLAWHSCVRDWRNVYRGGYSATGGGVVEAMRVICARIACIWRNLGSKIFLIRTPDLNLPGWKCKSFINLLYRETCYT